VGVGRDTGALRSIPPERGVFIVGVSERCGLFKPSFPLDGGCGTFVFVGREKPPRSDGPAPLFIEPERGEPESCVCIFRFAPERMVASGGRGTLREKPPRSPIPPSGRLFASFTGREPIVPRVLRSAPERSVASGGLGTFR